MGSQNDGSHLYSPHGGGGGLPGRWRGGSHLYSPQDGGGVGPQGGEGVGPSSTLPRAGAGVGPQGDGGGVPVGRAPRLCGAQELRAGEWNLPKITCCQRTPQPSSVSGERR